MKNLLITFLFIVIFCGVSNAQKGTAESDYYPQEYTGGSTFSGVVTSVNEEKQEINLTYMRGKK
jgi:hypothetical protein